MKHCYTKVLTFLWICLFPFFLSTPTAAQDNPLQPLTKQLLPYQDEITVEYLEKHLSVISHDSLEGRDTGSEGQKIAARYLAEQYRSLGLKPMGDQGTYLQNFKLSALKRDSTVFELYKNGALMDRSVESKSQTAHFIRSFGGSVPLEGEIVYAGFGITDRKRKINHLGSMDLKGKWVMVFQQFPYVVEGDTIVSPSLSGKRRFDRIIEQRGAAGMLIIAPMAETEYQASATQMAQLAYAEPRQYELDYLGEPSGGLPMGYNMVKPELANQLLGIEPGLDNLRQYRDSLIKNISDFTPRETNFSLTHTPYTSKPTMDTENVAALLEGSDPELREEVVVLTSHYDHVGIGQPDSTGDAIYNGADDDGSGTVALLNIAKALTAAQTGGFTPRRSILFLHVTGEEKGLFGSRYYSDHPVIPMDKTVTNINIDMIGRIDSEHEAQEIIDYSYIIGSEIISSELDSLLKKANAHSGDIILDKGYNDLKDPNQFYRRSDHWNFGRFRVPFIFFFTGVHEDYHKPSDEIEKIRFEKMAKIIKTVYATTVVVANEEIPPRVDNEAFIDITKTDPR